MAIVARLISSLIPALLWAAPAVLWGQARTDTIPDDFLALADLRGAVATEIASLERQLRDLQDTLPAMERAARFAGAYVNAARRDSAQLAAMPRRTLEQERRLQDATRYLESVDADKNAPSAARDSLISKSKQLAAKKELAGRIQAKIAGLLNPEQQFKRTMSITFAALIGLVILGFFVLAFRDAIVRERVFGGQAGMQFLTLFSLVIAIILFGITGVLEGKELAALLGGLSGYILGRTEPGLRQEAATASTPSPTRQPLVTTGEPAQVVT
jgi:hypothetical protein